MESVFEQRLSTNPFTVQRQAKIQRLIQFIEDHPGKYESQVRSLFALNTGHKRATIQDYINTVVEAGLIDRHERKLYAKGQVDARPLRPDLSGNKDP